MDPERSTGKRESPDGGKCAALEWRGKRLGAPRGRADDTRTIRLVRRAQDHWRGTSGRESCRAAARRGSARRGRHTRVVHSQPINPLYLREREREREGKRIV